MQQYPKPALTQQCLQADVLPTRKVDNLDTWLIAGDSARMKLACMIKAHDRH